MGHIVSFPNKTLTVARIRESYSAAGEDLILEDIFLKDFGLAAEGGYLDWMPASAIYGSNTYKFYLQNWRGISVLPDHALAPDFASRRPKDIIIDNELRSEATKIAAAHCRIHLLNTSDPSYLKELNITQLRPIAICSANSAIDLGSASESEEALLLKAIGYNLVRKTVSSTIYVDSKKMRDQ